MDTGRLFSRQTQAFVSPALRQITIEVQRVGGVNLGQGVCQLPVPELVIEAASKAAADGVNRYTNPRGLSSLREALVRKLEHFNRIQGLDPETDVLVTCGATGAFEGVCAVLLDPGDEVVVFEPYYPYHLTALRRYQADVKTVPLTAPDWAVDFDLVRSMIGPKTKFVLLNTPGNPTGKVFTSAELEEMAEVLEGTDTLLVTDEIYEYMTFDGRRHVSPASIEGLRERTVTIGGYSKTFSITGWRIGYMALPAALSGPMSAFLDAVYVCAPAPLQEAVAQGVFLFGDDYYRRLCSKYESKRDLFYKGLQESGLDPVLTEGAYYMSCGYESAFPDMESDVFVAKMIAECGVGAVPSGDFVRDPSGAKWVRFCLAVEDDVLHDALSRLKRLTSSGSVLRPS
ncbi:MAG: pyridoxal phosphate-dependent aminotransferase [Armatimonadetes bacterium]|nr:pyridoxal phosphate-dependent aminotransferase [Armatimonadota bacterium]